MQGAGHKERRPSSREGGRSQPGGSCVQDHSVSDARPLTGESFVERAAKAEMVTELKVAFKAAHTVVVAQYAGLTVAQMQTLRKQAKAADTKVKVAKNRLAKIALEGTDVASIGPLLKGPTLIAFSGDPVAATKVVANFAKTHEKLVILGGAMGKTALDANGVKQLASLPSLDELRAILVGLCQAPATKCAQLSKEPAAKAARLIEAFSKKQMAA